MPVGNLEFIKSASGTSVSSLSVTDCFSADYDVYYITSNTFKPSANANGIFRLIDSGGSVISASEYDYATLSIKAYTTFAETKATATTFMGYTFYSDANGTQGSGLALYIINPNNSSSYTFALYQESSFNTGSGGLGRKGIGVHKVAEEITGINFAGDTGTADFDIKVYGVK